MKAGIIIQARINSRRLPGKALLDLGGVTLLGRVIERMKPTGLPIVVATSDSTDDDVIEFEALAHSGVSVFRGSLNNVRNRFYCCALGFGFDVIIRVTSDNPFSEPAFVLQALEKINCGASYARVSPSSCPDGSNIEAFTFSELQRSEEDDIDVTNTFDAEHVTPGIIKRLKGSEHFMEFLPIGLGCLDEDIHVGIDTLEDYIKIRRLYAALGEVSVAEPDLLYRVVSIFRSKPELFKRGRRHEL